MTQKTKSKKIPEVLTLTPSHAHWPRQLDGRLGSASPSRLWGIGNLEILARHRAGLFCSIRCPGDAILSAYDAARKLRDDGGTVISGFHSPVEKECLRILLRGEQPVIICLARGFRNIRIPTDWRPPLDAGRLLLLSPFESRPRRPDTRSAHRRNELVVALSDEVLIIYAEAGGSVERISDLADRWQIPRRQLVPHATGQGAWRQ